MKTFTEKRFFEWHEDEVSVTLRNRSGSYGGGSETLVVSYQRVTGTLNPGGHPGSYNGQDAYNDMLVTEDAIQDEIVHRGGRNGPDPGRKLL